MKIDWETIGIKELSALISGKLRESGIDAILVGGACVSIYTKNRYLSFDLDFVTYATLKEVTPVLAKVGFRRKSSRHFTRHDCPFFIEFVAPPVAMGNEPLKGEQKLKMRLGTIILLTPTDSVKDRLAAYYHWNDPQALEQALMVAEAQRIAGGEALVRERRTCREISGISEETAKKMTISPLLSIFKPDCFCALELLHFRTLALWNFELLTCCALSLFGL